MLYDNYFPKLCQILHRSHNIVLVAMTTQEFTLLDATIAMLTTFEHAPHVYNGISSYLRFAWEKHRRH